MIVNGKCSFIQVNECADFWEKRIGTENSEALQKFGSKFVFVVEIIRDFSLVKHLYETQYFAILSIESKT